LKNKLTSSSSKHWPLDLSQLLVFTSPIKCANLRQATLDIASFAHRRIKIYENQSVKK